MTGPQIKVPDELLFGTIAVREGYVTPGMIEDCVKHQMEKGGQGPKLGMLLIQKGHMSDEQVAAILEIQRRQVKPIEADPKRGGLFGHLCLDLGFVSIDKLDVAIHEQEDSALKGQPSMLGQILMRQNAITTDQFLKVLKLQRRGITRCPGCDTFYNIEDQPEGAKFVCRRCGTICKVQPSDQAKQHAGTDTAIKLAAQGRGQEVSGQFGRYVILEEIGRGGMGVVYKVLHRDLNTTFALKTLKESDLATQETVDRFRREAQAAAKMKHPNIVAIHDAGEENGVHYIAMDYVEGRSLAYRMAQRPKTRELVAILEKVARAVQHAHDQGIIHRDMKPGNVMISKDSEPHVMDFGLAKFMDHKTMLTRTGSFLGTPFYMAPEQIRGEARDVDPQSDVYAMGVILFEIISGRPPHMGQNSVEIFNKILNEDPPDPLELNPKAHPDLQVICLKAIEKDKTLRYKTAAEFADDLKRYLDGEPIQARAPNIVAKVIRKAQKNSTATLSVALVLLIFVIAATFVFFYFRDRREFEKAYARGSEAFRKGDYAGARLDLERANYLRPSVQDIVNMLRVIATKTLEGDELRRREQERGAQLERVRPRLKEADGLISNLGASIPGEALDGPAIVKACGQIEAILAEVVIEAPHAAEAYYFLALSQELRGELRGAVEHLNRALQEDEQHIDALSLRARLLLRSVMAARSALNRPFFSPDGPAEADERAGSIADFRTVAKAQTSSPVQRDFAAIAIAFLESRGAAVRADLDAFLARYAADLEALRLRADPADLRRLIRYRPLATGARVQLAAVFEVQGKPADAQQTLQEAVKALPNEPLGWCALGAFYARHRPTEAEAAFTQAIQAAPNSPVGFIEQGRFRLGRGQFEPSLAPLNKAALLSPSDPLVFHLRAQACIGLMRHADALVDADTVVRLLPESGAGYEIRGRIKYEQKQWDAALVDFELAAVRDPSARARLAPMVEEAMRQRK